MTQIEMKKLENEITMKMIDMEGLKYKTDATTDIQREQIEKDIKVSQDKLKGQLEALREKNEQFNRKLIEERQKFNTQMAEKRRSKSKVA